MNMHTGIIELLGKQQFCRTPKPQLLEGTFGGLGEWEGRDGEGEGEGRRLFACYNVDILQFQAHHFHPIICRECENYLLLSTTLSKQVHVVKFLVCELIFKNQFGKFNQPPWRQSIFLFGLLWKGGWNTEFLWHRNSEGNPATPWHLASQKMLSLQS